MQTKILVLDDEKEIADLVALYLNNEGYEVHKFYDSKDALEYMKNNRVDLALLDVMMPEISGFEICRIIREKYMFPVIMLTAKVEDVDKIQGLSLGADDYITKPFSVKLVLMRVEAVLRRVEEHESQVSENILTYENVRLDQTAHLVSVAENSIALTNTEYELLELFLLHPGRVFSRDHLLNQVWGYDIACEEKTVNIHIMNLRRKLGTNIIETIRGVGYRLGKED